MDEKPLLVFPEPQEIERAKLGGGGNPYKLPQHSRQKQRLTPQFKNIKKAFDAKRLELQEDVAGAEPEKVLVIETVDRIDDFYKAVIKIKGMEWMGEVDEEGIEPDEDFFDSEDKEKPLGGRLFLIMSNQAAMTEMLSLWTNYSKDAGFKFPYGMTKWRDVFQRIKMIRPWGVEDRLLETGVIEDLGVRIESGDSKVRFEAEMWYKDNDSSQQERTVQFVSQVKAMRGRVISQCAIPEIKYLGMLVEVEFENTKELEEFTASQLANNDYVKFYRPVGQAMALPSEGKAEEISVSKARRKATGNPTVALFDGYPLSNHDLLSGRLIVDDPDGWEGAIEAKERKHGTAMASLIIHGELDANDEPIKRPIYTRPILKPIQQAWFNKKFEMIPEDILPIDLVHKAVRRLFDGDGDEEPVAESVRIINLSIGDMGRHFDNSMSPWARLIDWLSYKYNVLFIVSAGNHQNDIELKVPQKALSTLTAKMIEKETFKALACDNNFRRLLSPSEAMNAITVGATHEDLSTPGSLGRLTDLVNGNWMPSPINALGLGYRRSVKPDVLMPGGRQLFMEKISTRPNIIFQIPVDTGKAPGQRVASPGPGKGFTNYYRYTRGTSNATALTTRAASFIYDLVDTLSADPENDILHYEFFPEIVKAMLVHGASWGNAVQGIFEAVKSNVDPNKFREYVARFLGYGRIDYEEATTATDSKVTILGCGELEVEKGHIYHFPLPSELISKAVKRRLVVTLAYITPVNVSNVKYKAVDLWVSAPYDNFQMKRLEADWQATKRGTVQHEVLYGDDAVPFMKGDTLAIQVNSREYGVSKYAGKVKYGLVITLEVAEKLKIYDEIKTALRVPITATPSSSR